MPRAAKLPASRPAPALARLSISLPATLLQQLDAMVERRVLPNRSQVLAELIRHALADPPPDDDVVPLAGTITLIYGRGRGVRQQIADVHAAYLKEVISSQHVYLEAGQSLEVLLVQGSARRLRRLCDGLRKVRGVLQARLVTTTTLLPPLHARADAGRVRRTTRG